MAGQKASVKVERNDEVVRLRGEGLTLEAIGQRFGISRVRVRQILQAVPARKTRIAARAAAAEKALRQSLMLSDSAVRNLFVSIDCMEFTARTYNWLRKVDWRCLGDIVAPAESFWRGERSGRPRGLGKRGVGTYRSYGAGRPEARDWPLKVAR